MTQLKVSVVVGSLRKESINARLAAALQGLAPQDIVFERLRLDDLPLYNQDDDAAPAQSVQRLKAQVVGSQALLFVTPEYNRSIPGVLKNALDHGSRPYGQSVWAGRPAGVVGISGGATGTAAAQQHLRNILAYLDVPTLGQPEVFLQLREGFFDADGNIGREETRKFLQSWMDKYVAWIKKHIA